MSLSDFPEKGVVRGHGKALGSCQGGGQGSEGEGSGQRAVEGSAAPPGPRPAGGGPRDEAGTQASVTVRQRWGAVRQLAPESWGERCPHPGLTRKEVSLDGTLRLRVTGRLTLGPRDRAPEAGLGGAG